MFRISQYASRAFTKISCQNAVLLPHNDRKGCGQFAIQRFFGSRKGKDDDERPCDKTLPECKHPQPMTPDCRPPNKLQPCKPKPVDCMHGRRPLQPFQDCPRPNRMDEMPQLECPYEDHDGPRKKAYLITFIVGSLVFLGTAYFFYKDLNKGPERVKKKGRRYMRPKVVKKNPAESKEIPPSVPYLLIGGGTASFSAFRAIKSAEPDAKVLVITQEGDFPYMRPPLSKEIWSNTDPTSVRTLTFKQWNGSERSLFYEPDEFYLKCKELMDAPNGGVAVARGWKVTHVDVVDRKAFLEDGYEICYDKCLIATGAIPKNLDIFAKAEPAIQDKVTLYREIFDFQELYETTEEAQNIAIIGGGFLGSELACALARRGKGKYGVYQIFREGGNMGKVLPEYLSFWTTEKVKREGVQVIPQAEVVGVCMKDDKLLLDLSNGRTVEADHAIVSIGVAPNTDMAEKSDLEVDPELGGYLVNTELQARSHLFIAGDSCCFYDTKLGRRRVEHHDHAVVSGRLAGENMTGAARPYWHQSMFWSDLGPDVGYEAIGIVDSALPTVGVFAKASSEDSPKGVVTATDEGIRSKTEEKIPEECKKFAKTDPEGQKLAEQIRKTASAPQAGEDFGKGVIFYLRDDIVVGIVLWNVFNRMNIARQVLKDERKYEDLNEVAKLFNIHEPAEGSPDASEGEETPPPGATGPPRCATDEKDTAEECEENEGEAEVAPAGEDGK